MKEILTIEQTQGINEILNKIQNKEFLTIEQVKIVKECCLSEVVKHFGAENVTILDFGNKGNKVDIDDSIYFNLNSEGLLEIGIEVLY
ncbi:MAG: hypothetical protein ACRCTZ_16070 [Sarcina sp.]